VYRSHSNDSYVSTCQSIQLSRKKLLFVKTELTTNKMTDEMKIDD